MLQRKGLRFWPTQVLGSLGFQEWSLCSECDRGVLSISVSTPDGIGQAILWYHFAGSLLLFVNFHDVLSFFQYSLSLIVAFIFAFLVACGINVWCRSFSLAVVWWLASSPRESYLTPRGFKQCLRWSGWTCKPNGLAKVLLHPAHVRKSCFFLFCPMFDVLWLPFGHRLEFGPAVWS